MVFTKGNGNNFAKVLNSLYMMFFSQLNIWMLTKQNKVILFFDAFMK